MSALEHADLPLTTRRSAVRMLPPPPQTRTWPRSAFPLMILALLAIGMVGHLALQTRIQEQGFEIGALQTQAGQLSARQSVLQAMLDQQATPQQLAYAASQAGMVANPYSTFVNLATGQIVGLAKPVTGTEVPIISAAAAPAGTIPAHVAAEAASAQAGPEPTQDLA